jgi:hypothetical protein
LAVLSLQMRAFRRLRKAVNERHAFKCPKGPEGEGEMTAYVLSRIFTIGIGGTPMLTFEAQNLREAQELCHEQWLKDELADAKSGGASLWDGKANLRARIARPDESALFVDAKNDGQPSDGLMLVYLVKLDGGETDGQPVDPGAFPPRRNSGRR